VRGGKDDLPLYSIRSVRADEQRLSSVSNVARTCSPLSVLRSPLRACRTRSDEFLIQQQSDDTDNTDATENQPQLGSVGVG
jgi:hypothetical protein